MNINVIHELKKFLNNPNVITLELSFVNFESSVFQGIRTIKNLTTKKRSLIVTLVKNSALGSVSFFFRDSPTYQFALTVEESDLNNDNNSYEILVSKFIVLGNEPIKGNQLIINSYSITVYASLNDNKPRSLDSFSINQIYSDCSSLKSYNYALGIEALKKPTNVEPKKNSQNNSIWSNKYLILGIISFIIVIIITRINRKIDYNTNDINIENNEFENDLILADTTANITEVSEFWIEKKYQNFSYSIPEYMKFHEDLSNENQQVFADEENNVGITISHSIIPTGNESETIRTIIGNNQREFALGVNDEQIKNFSDFRLIDYSFEMLGNIESFLVTQSSNQLSGKNISMIMKSYFVISSPYYYSISLSYPENSVNGEEIARKIVDSFKFNTVESGNLIEIDTIE
jgi:hypothetical protein